MDTPRVGIVGLGVVGKVHHEAFRAADIQTVVFDKYDARYSGREQAEAINTCDLVFVSVPTP